MPRGLPPFLQVGDGVEPGDWTVDYLAQTAQPLTFVPEWDCSTPVEVHASLYVTDRAALLASASLDPSDRIGLVIEARSSSVVRNQVSTPLDIDRDGRFTTSISLDPTHTGGKATFRRQLVLLARHSEGELGARRPGSIIWEDDEPTPLILEADYPRFPAEQVDFAKVALDPLGLCVMRVDDDDLHANFAGVARLVLNSAHPVVKAATSGEEGVGPGLALAMIQYEAASALVQRALENRDLVAGQTDFDEGTLGHTLLGVVGGAFPDLAVADVRALLAANPEKFTALLQATFGPTGKELQ